MRGWSAIGRPLIESHHCLRQGRFQHQVEDQVMLLVSQVQGTSVMAPSVLLGGHLPLLNQYRPQMMGEVKLSV